VEWGLNETSVLNAAVVAHDAPGILKDCFRQAQADAHLSIIQGKNFGFIEHGG
jgi:hypothetical protein